MFDPNAAKETYDPKKQERENTFWLPDDGTFHLVITTMQFKRVGQNATLKNRLNLHILKVIEGADKPAKELADHVGGRFPIDLWWNMEKAANARRLSHLCLATGVKKAFDEMDKGALVAGLTAVPFMGKVVVKGEGNRREANLIIVKDLPKKEREKYTSDPDWLKIVGEASDRFLEDQDFSGDSRGRGNGRRGRSGGGGGGGQTEDPFTDPADDPFAGSGF